MMSDRDKPIYNPESAGDLDDYWSSSAAFEEMKEQKHKEILDALTSIESIHQWLKGFLTAVLAEDSDFQEALIQLARDWHGSEVERDLMMEVAGSVINLQVHW